MEEQMLATWRSLGDASVFEALIDPTFRQPIETNVTASRACVVR